MSTLRTGISLQLANSIIFVLCSYCIHFFLGRTLTPAEYGAWGTVLVITDFTYLFTNNGIRQAVSEAVAVKRYDTISVMKRSVLFLTVLTAFFSTVFFFGASVIASSFHADELKTPIQIISIIILATGLYVITEGIHNGLFLFRREAGIGIAYSLLKLVIIPIVLLSDGNAVIEAELGLIIAALGGLILGILSLKKTRSLFVSDAGIIPFKRFVSYAGHFSTLYVAVSVVLSVDSVFLRLYDISKPEIGYYTGAVNFAKITYYLISAFPIILLPVFSGLYADGRLDEINTRMTSILSGLLAFILPIPVVLSVKSPEILGLFYTDDYREGAAALSILSFSNFLMGLFVIFNVLLQAFGRQWVSTIIAGCLLLSDIILQSVLVPWYGTLGSALSGLAVILFFLIISYISVRDICGRVIHAKSMVILLGNVAIAIVMKLSVHVNQNIFILAVYIVLVYTLYLAVMGLTGVIDCRNAAAILGRKRQ